MKQLIAKFLIFVILVGSLVPLFPAKPAKAQFVVEFGPAATALITSIVTATTNTSLATGVIGTNVATIAGIRAALSSTCQTTLVALDSTDAVATFLDTASNSALSVIGGGAFEYTKLSAKTAKALAAKSCIDIYVEALSHAPNTTLLISQDLQREQDKYTKISNSLRGVIQDLSQQQNASVKDILKAFMVKVILNLNQSLTTQLVNKMVDKFKISNYLQYGDALASQVYSMDYINQNIPGDARQQMMVRSILQSSLIPDKIKTAQAYAVSKAQEYTAAGCQAAVDNYNSSNTDDFWKCVAKLGNENASPQFQFFQAVDQAAAADAAGKTSAAQELAQSKGYAPPRDCSGSIAQQQANDAAYDEAAKEADAAGLISAKLASAALDGKTTAAEVQKANDAYQAALAKLNAVPTTVPKPIIQICKAIDSPASFVADSIDGFLKAHLDESSNLKTENLPFYANFLAGVASNFLTNILTGGKSTSQVLKEGGIGALNGVLIGVTGTTSPTTIPSRVEGVSTVLPRGPEPTFSPR